MRAVCVVTFDGPKALTIVERAEPIPAPNQVLVEVRAVAPAFPDLLMSKGEYQVKPKLPFGPGFDFAGVVTDSPEFRHFQAFGRRRHRLTSRHRLPSVTEGRGEACPRRIRCRD